MKNLIMREYKMQELLPFIGYIDPGSGSILIQALLAGAFGALLTIKLWSGRIGHLARRISGRGNDSRPDSSDN